MGSKDTDLLDEGGGGWILFGASSVSCSICLETVADNKHRSKAKLQCGHEFHLDCIGSAFNAKGVMQCPNCRKVEKGQWLYANGCHSFPDLHMDDWTHNEDLYDLSYSEMPFGVHWCPFSGLTRVPSSFEEEGELPSTAYHDLLGHHAIFPEHTAASSAAHPCPYVAYFQPLQPSSSNSNEGIADEHSFSNHWDGPSGHNNIPNAHTFTAVNLHYHTWDHPPHSFSRSSRHISSADQTSVSSATLRTTRGVSNGLPTSGSLLHPFLLGHGSGPRTRGSVVSPMFPTYPGSSSRARDRAQGLNAYHQQQQPNSLVTRLPIFSNVRRSGPRVPLGSVSSSSSRTRGFYVFPSSVSSRRNLQEAENSVPNHFYAWEQDFFPQFPLISVDRELSWWGPFHQAAGGADGSRASSYLHRHGSGRTLSQNRSENSSYQPIHPVGQMHPFI